VADTANGKRENLPAISEILENWKDFLKAKGERLKAEEKAEGWMKDEVSRKAEWSDWGERHGRGAARVAEASGCERIKAES
jgi:hypothetical protein